VTIRPAAVAGTWYPARPGALAREVDEYVAAVTSPFPRGPIVGIVVPHAGIMFSGPVAAHAFKAVSSQQYDVAVLVGPSHFVAFEGVAAYPDGAFDCPFGPIPIDDEAVRAIAAASGGLVQSLTSAHAREHSLEMQLPFLGRLLPGVPIVPLLIGRQSRATIERLSPALSHGLGGRRALLVASTDLSHYYDAETASRLDGAVCDAIDVFGAEPLLARFESYPESERGRSVGCGMGAAIAVLMAARALGARDARVLRYAHSGDISGDPACVVGYVAAALGTFDAD
jgi:AmmeMemoRadiSam system protein B